MALSPLIRSGFGSSKRFLGLYLALLMVVTLLSTGCHFRVTDPKDPKFIVAEKGNWHITRGELDAEIASYLKQRQVTPAQVGPSKMPLLETAVLDNMVLKKLLLDKAAAMQPKDVDKDEAAALDHIKQRFPSQTEFDAQLKSSGMTLDELKARIHEQVLISKVLDAEAFKNVEPTEQEVNDFYLKAKDHFNIPPKLRASRVLVLVDEKTMPAEKIAKKKAIDKAHDRVTKGEDFSKVATEVSEDRYSAPKGGDISWFQKGENEPAFDQVVFATKVGTVTPVFETPLGYQFVKVTDSQPAGVVSLADARATITNYLRQGKKGQQGDAYTKDLLANGGVTFYLVRAPLPTQPPAGADSTQGGAAPAEGAPAEAAPAAAAAPADAPAATPAPSK